MVEVAMLVGITPRDCARLVSSATSGHQGLFDERHRQTGPRLVAIAPTTGPARYPPRQRLAADVMPGADASGSQRQGHGAVTSCDVFVILFADLPPVSTLERSWVSAP